MNKTTIATKKNDNKLLKELIRKQLKNTQENKKLYLHDMQRICKNINTSIFGDECCIWNGYITNLNKSNKGTYINFYFRHKKVALHRLLYSNYVSDISVNEYLKYKCPNKGICCNINHLEKFKYNKVSKKTSKNLSTDKKKKITIVTGKKINNKKDNIDKDVNNNTKISVKNKLMVYFN